MLVACTAIELLLVLIPAQLVLMLAECTAIELLLMLMPKMFLLIPAELVLMPSLPSFYKAPISPDPQTPTVELVLIPAELVLIPSSTSSSLLELSSLNIMSALPPDCF